LKRFVNIYRLLKAVLPPDEESSFLRSAGPTGLFDAPSKNVLWLPALFCETQ
jgi:hypothetical protein